MNWKELRTHAEAHGKLTAVLLCMLLLLALSLTLLGCAAELASRNYLSARIDTVQRSDNEFAVIKARPLNVSERVGLNQEMYTRPLYMPNLSMQVCGVICTGIDPFSFIRKVETIDDDNLLSPEFVMNLEEFAFYFNEYFPRMLFVHEERYREYFERFVGTSLEGTDDPYQFFFCKIPESEEKVEALLSGGTSIEGEFTWQARVLSDRGLHILWQETPQILNILLYVGVALFLVSLSVVVWVFVKFFLAEGAGAGPPQRGIGRKFLSLVMWVFVILLAMTFIVAGVFVLATNAAYADRTLPEIREFLFDYRLAGLLTGGAFIASLLGVGLAWPIAVRKKRASEDRT